MPILTAKLIVVIFMSILFNSSLSAQTTNKTKSKVAKPTVKNNIDSSLSQKDSAKTANNSILDIKKIRKMQFTSGKIYFSGSGFPSVKFVDTKDQALLNRLLDLSAPGTAITFDNCVYKDDNNKTQLLNRSIILLLLTGLTFSNV